MRSSFPFSKTVSGGTAGRLPWHGGHRASSPSTGWRTVTSGPEQRPRIARSRSADERAVPSASTVNPKKKLNRPASPKATLRRTSAGRMRRSLDDGHGTRRQVSDCHLRGLAEPALPLIQVVDAWTLHGRAVVLSAVDGDAIPGGTCAARCRVPQPLARRGPHSAHVRHQKEGDVPLAVVGGERRDLYRVREPELRPPASPQACLAKTDSHCHGGMVRVG